MIHEVISLKRKNHTPKFLFMVFILCNYVRSFSAKERKETKLCKETLTQKVGPPKNNNRTDEEERDHCLSGKLSIAIVRKKSQRINLN